MSNLKNNPVAIVLGGTSPHVTLINKLKDRGYYVILVDYLTNSPGVAVADEHIRESTLDQEKVLLIAKACNASLVISTCIDQANSTCCYVAEKLGLPKPYSFQTSLNVTDKGLMKAIMAKSEIPTSPFQVVKAVDEINWETLCFPVVVKPVDCNSSKGVYRADSREEVLKYTEEDLKLSRNGNVIIEGFNEGREIQVDCFAEEHGVKVLMTREKKHIIGANGMVLQSTGSVIPANLTEALRQEAAEIADKIAKAFRLQNTPFFYQAILTTHGISVIEFAPRIGGGLSYYLIRHIVGVDIVECAIDSFLGNLVTVNVTENAMCYSTNLIYMRPGVFDRFEGFEKLKAEGIITEAFQMKKSGTEISSDMRSGNRVGAFLVQADNYEALKEREKIAYAGIQVIDSDGNEVMNRNIVS